MISRSVEGEGTKKNSELTSAQNSTVVSTAIELPTSWYVAMSSKELPQRNQKRNKPQKLSLFGRNLIAWRDEAGRPVLMDEHCVHQGASLAQGRVINDCVRCPFHDWEFDKSGKCQTIPRVAYIPQTARQRTYPTVERYGYIWAWYGTPEPLFSLPLFPEAENRQDYKILRATFKVPATARRVIENGYDQDHFAVVHKLNASSIELTILNPETEARWIIERGFRRDAWFGVLIEARINGFVGFGEKIAKLIGLDLKSYNLKIAGWPGGLISETFANDELRFVALNTVAPTGAKETVQHLVLAVKKTGNPLRDRLYSVIFGLQTRVGAAQDLPIWSNLGSEEAQGVYTRRDQGLLEFRKFWKQWLPKN